MARFDECAPCLDHTDLADGAFEQGAFLARHHDTATGEKKPFHEHQDAKLPTFPLGLTHLNVL